MLPYIYRAIRRLEREWGRRVGFNRRALSPDDLLIWVEARGGVPLEDRSVSSTAFLFYRGAPFILHNPAAEPLELLLSLGHEVGHLALGHHDYMFFRPHTPVLWARNGEEKDAGIIGFLAWLPTRELERLLRDPELYHPEALARELATCDSEWPFLLQACQARLRIWQGLKRIADSFLDLKKKKCY